jgi:hypothetical protein
MDGHFAQIRVEPAWRNEKEISKIENVVNGDRNFVTRYGKRFGELKYSGKYMYQLL